MHELSICKSIVESILQELDSMDPRPKSLVSARIVAGELRQIIPEFMQDAYSVTTKGTAIEGSVLEIRHLTMRGRCNECGWSGELSTGFCNCGACKSSKVQVEGGMELFLENLEVEY